MAFIKRETAPTADNKYYKHVSAGGLNDCILIKDGSCLPNCVGYAFGRAYEILGTKPTLSRRNAENWYDNTADGYIRTREAPKLGCICCWRKGQTNNSADGCGHVAVVEDFDNTYVYLSESNYSGTAFKMRKVKRSTMYLGKGYTWQGYIIIGDFNKPVEIPKPVVTVSAPVKQIVHTVKKGETLSSIAKIYGTRWTRIYADNKGTIGANPNRIKVGQRLIINK